VAYIHSSLPGPFRCLLRKEYLYNRQSGHGDFVSVLVIGVSSYKGEVLSFDVLVDHNGGLFHYIPPTALVFDEAAEELPLSDLAYENCPGSDISVFELEALRDQKITLHPSKAEQLKKIQGEYLFTVDWPDDNILHHVLKLDNHCLAIYPSHKILFGQAGLNSELPDWKKLRYDWIIKRTPKPSKSALRRSPSQYLQRPK
jgi:hypothetical protein